MKKNLRKKEVRKEFHLQINSGEKNSYPKPTKAQR